ncbi:heptaprenyl diphosphate synthase component 1 [Cohnella thailandensis]|uniref:Heptaprenyl diphosphate synthase component 1 n=1 Tax=Cohnella thailandensis TaxID=557557 RepID=A0A841SVX5_9BACL|nr:heptaprenyl diphosphate synthase component 1 [Cohnella thailandensis]MBB6635392.1 heptaprenyl diphosphate synthase component 1 [Cohnella thailandensis]MBP1974772.1 heptaprenyl diphosphate synthase [Cohnella thailandensis]
MTRNHLAQMAQKYMDYDMITLHTDVPEMPEGRIRLLHAMLSHQPSAVTHKDLLAVVTSLVQMGLDIHDQVDNETGASGGGMKGMRSRQLKVLAGDYFSGRFYHLLAQAGQIDMIRRMGEAICDLNRVKVLFYSKMKQMKLNAEEYLHHGSEIKSGLFLSFTHLMTGLYERVWPEMIERFTRCELLVQEIARAEKPSPSPRGWGVWHILQEGNEEDRRAIMDDRADPSSKAQLMSKYSVVEKLGDLLLQAISQLQQLIQRLPSDKLIKELQQLLEPFLSRLGPIPAAGIKEPG